MAPHTQDTVLFFFVSSIYYPELSPLSWILEKLS